MAAAPRRMLGLIVAVVGLVSQLALGAAVLPDAPSAADQVAAATVLCQTGRGHAPPPADHAPAPSRPLAFALALPSVVPAPAPLLPPPPAAAIGRDASVARPRAPPALPRAAAQPRGPPALA